MRTPNQCIQLKDIKRQSGGCPAVRICRVVALALVPILVLWAAFDTTVEASEPSGAPAEVDASDALAAYRLAPGDRLKIVVFDEEQLSGEFIVDGTGGILLPVVGQVSVEGLTLPEAQQLVANRFADGVLVHPAVSVRIPEYRPIFVTGDVRKPGSYPFLFGGSVKAAIAAAGGEGPPTEQLTSVAISDFISAEERVRQLETNRLALRVRKARLEAQRDERENFAMPQSVGFDFGTVDLPLVYANENDAFLRLEKTYQDQLETIKQQRPRIEAEIKAVTDQIATEEGRLGIVNEHLADLEGLFAKRLLRKDVLIQQRIEKALVQAEISRLEAEVAHLRQTMGDLEVKIGDVEASYKRQVLGELQETSQRLRDVEAIIGTARKLRDVKAENARIGNDGPDYTILVSRTKRSGVITFNAAKETMLEPGDVIEVRLSRKSELPPSSETAQHLERTLTLPQSLASTSMPDSR